MRVFIIKEADTDYAVSACLSEETAKEHVAFLNQLGLNYKYDYTDVALLEEQGTEIIVTPPIFNHAKDTRKRNVSANDHHDNGRHLKTNQSSN